MQNFSTLNQRFYFSFFTFERWFFPKNIVEKIHLESNVLVTITMVFSTKKMKNLLQNEIYYVICE